MSTRIDGGDAVEPEVSGRPAERNGHESGRDAERLGGRPLERDASERNDEPEADAYDEHEEHADAVDVEPDGHPDDSNTPEAEDSPDGSEAQPAEWEGRLRAVDVHHVTFPRASLTRRGYDERSVDEFLSRVETEIVWLVEEKADLRDEVARLRRQVRSTGDAPVPQMEEAQAQAVRLLAKAQQLADSYVAEAEDYSKRVSQEARQQYEDTVAEARAAAGKVVEEAQERAAALVLQAEEEARAAAERAAREAATELDRVAAEPVGIPPTAPAVDVELLERVQAEKQGLEQQVAYLRTFSQVTRTQLRAYLEALLADVEEEWGKAHPGAAAVVRSAEPPTPLPQQPPAAARPPRRAREAATNMSRT